MAKVEAQRSTITWNSTEIGVVDFSFDTTISEIDVTDTKTAVGESEFLGAKKERSFSFTTYKVAGTADLTLNDEQELIIVVTDTAETPNTSTYTGNAILLSANVTGNIDGAVEVAYTGRFTGAVAET